jgi:hypothetical protein
MEMLGWRTTAFVGFNLGISGAAVFAAVLFATDRGAIAQQDFYAAAAQILPILLLAHIVRLASIRSLIFAGRERRREHIRSGQQLADRATALRADAQKVKGVNAGIAQDFDRIDQELTKNLETLNQDAEETDRSDGKLVEIIAGNLFVTLIIGLAGGAATLVDLAGKSDSPVIFVATIIGLVWTGLGLLLFEVLVFTAPPSLTSKQGASTQDA